MSLTPAIADAYRNVLVTTPGTYGGVGGTATSKQVGGTLNLNAGFGITLVTDVSDPAQPKITIVNTGNGTGALTTINDNNAAGTYYPIFTRAPGPGDINAPTGTYQMDTMYLDQTTTPLTYNPSTSTLSLTHITVEGVTSTGATGTGSLVFATSPSVSNLTVTGHATLEGQTLTGVTGTGKLVLDNSPTFSGHPTIEGVTATGATGTGKFVFDTSPSISGLTLTSNPTVSGTSLTFSGNITAPAWTTNGIRHVSVPATLTDTSSTGTVANAYTNSFGGNTIAASNSVTYTNYSTMFVNSPVAGTNVSFTNAWSIITAGSILIRGTTLDSPTTFSAFPSSTTLSIGATSGTTEIKGRVKIEGVTSTGATGTGKVVFDTAPAITGITTLAIRDTSAAFDVTLAAASSTALTTGRTLTLDLVNANRTFKLSGDVTFGGTFTTAGAFSTTITSTANTNVTLPTSGTLLNTTTAFAYNMAF